MMLDVLGRLAFFEDISAADLELLLPFFKPCNYPRDAVVFEQGDLAEYLYLVVTGEVVIRYKPHDGPSMTVTNVHPGGVFGWSAAMGNVTYTSCAVCTQASETLRVKGADLRALCDKHPEVGKIILSRLAAVISERWESRRKQVMAMLSQGIRIPLDVAEKEETTMDKAEPEMKIEQLRGLIEQLSAYVEQFHGGSVEFLALDGKVLKVRLGGACLGCPLSPATLHGWVEGTVRQFFPEIERVEAE